MKRVIVAVVFLFFALFISVCGFFIVKYRLLNLSAALEGVIYNYDIDEKERIEGSIEEIIEMWERDERMLGFLMKQGDTLLIGQNVRLLRNCVDAGDNEDLEEACHGLHALVLALIEGEKAYFWNIF